MLLYFKKILIIKATIYFANFLKNLSAKSNKFTFRYITALKRVVKLIN